MYPSIETATNTTYSSPLIQLEEREEVISPVIWVVVALVFLMALSMVLVTAMSLYCISKGMRFTGQWGFVNWGLSARFSCTK